MVEDFRIIGHHVGRLGEIDGDFLDAMESMRDTITALQGRAPPVPPRDQHGREIRPELV